MVVKRWATLALPACLTRTHSNPTCLAWPAPSLTPAVTQPQSSSHQRARHFWPCKGATCVSIHFTYKGKATLLRVTGLCLVSPPPPFHFCHGSVTLGAGLETRFLIRDNYHGLYGLQAAVVPPLHGAPVPVAPAQSVHWAPSSPPDVSGGDATSSTTRCS